MTIYPSLTTINGTKASAHGKGIKSDDCLLSMDELQKALLVIKTPVAGQTICPERGSAVRQAAAAEGLDCLIVDSTGALHIFSELTFHCCECEESVAVCKSKRWCSRHSQRYDFAGILRFRIKWLSSTNHGNNNTRTWLPTPAAMVAQLPFDSLAAMECENEPIRNNNLVKLYQGNQLDRSFGK